MTFKMKSFLITFVLFVVSKASPVSDIRQEWEDFKIKFNKSYASAEEELRRFNNFVKSYELVTTFNALHAERGEISENSLELEINKYSDISLEEIPKGLVLSDFKNLTKELEEFGIFGCDESYDSPIPDAIDWREKGIVTPVKSQQFCGSCWAFSAVGTLEALYFKKHQKKEILSEQFLIDCDTVESGCFGGNPFLALHFISKNGIPREEDYPYEAWNEECRNDVKKSPVKSQGVCKLPMFDEDAMKNAVGSVGPISAVVHVTDEFKNYKKGVLKADCPFGLVDHAIVIVGYGTDPIEGDYWIVKNSWGEDWGDNGYIKIPRNDNYCGISYLSLYPTGL